MEPADTGLFRLEPLYFQDGIPVFCTYDEYLSNYDQISTDHLSALDAEGINPFMSSDTVEDLEQRTIDFALSHHPDVDRVLDAGVGPGLFLSRIPAREKHGVDISLGYLKRVKDMGIVPALAKLEQLPYADDSFDMVISTDVLEHVLDFLQSTIQLVRVLAEDGILVVRVPYRENLSTYLTYDEYDLVHVRSFDLPTLRSHFEKVLGLEFLGFELLRPHWRGVEFGIFEDAIDRKLTAEELAALENLPALKGFGDLYDALTGDLTQQIQALSRSDPEKANQAYQALSRHLEINVAFRKPSGHAFRDSLAHLLDPARAHNAGTSNAMGDMEILANRLAAIDTRLATDRSGKRFEKQNEQILQALQTLQASQTLQALQIRDQTQNTALSRLQAAIAELQRHQQTQSQILQILQDRVPEPPRSLRKRFTMRGIRRLLGL